MGLLTRLLDIFRKPQPAPAPPRPQPPPQSPTPTPPPSPAPPDAMLAAINARRAPAGRPPLAASPALMTAAESWAISMATAGILSHGGFSHRLHSAVGDVAGAENVAQGLPIAAATVAAWARSPDHLQNMLGPFTHVGWGRADGPGGPYWACMFADLG